LTWRIAIITLILLHQGGIETVPPKRHLDQEKRNRQNAKRRLRNAALLSSLKSLEKKVRAADVSARATLLSRYYSAVDRAAAKGILKPNAAARKKSRLAALLSGAGPEAPRKALAS
jgi:small subunit ribosomal protein S20